MANNQLIKFCCFSKSSRSTGRWNSWHNNLCVRPVLGAFFGTYTIGIIYF